MVDSWIAYDHHHLEPRAIAEFDWNDLILLSNRVVSVLVFRDTYWK